MLCVFQKQLLVRNFHCFCILRNLAIGFYPLSTRCSNSLALEDQVTFTST
nr:MAG TPA: hypothetical protein [Siphoviridae sp. ctD5s5]